MKAEKATDKLARDLLLLEAKRSNDWDDLTEEVREGFESLRPINLIKSTVKEMTEAPDIKGGVGKVAIGMATGYLLKKIFFRSSHNPLKNIAATAFQTLATNIATRNSDKIKEGGIDVFEIAKELIMHKKEQPE